jgi:hypothetical protein
MVSTLFHGHSEDVTQFGHGYHGFTAGRALNTKTFADQLLDRATSRMFRHVAGGKATDLQTADQRRVIRNLMRATDKLSDSMLIYKHLNPRYNG